MQQQPFQSQYTGGQPPAPMSYGGVPVGQPKKGLNILLIPLILTVVLLLAALGFGAWAYTGMQDYKNNVQPKIESAVEIAKQDVATQKDKEFVEKEKLPLVQYRAPSSAGSVLIQYPKTWSAYVTEDPDGNDVVNGYFHPDYVPGLKSGTDYALRLQVVSKSYSDVIKQYESKVKSGKVKISPYKAPKMADQAVGSRVDGEINTGQQDSMVLFPLRDKTIMISTESTQFVGDFEKIVLDNLVFNP